MKRVLEFDGIRAAAILFILLCHICFGMGWTAMGRFCANTFNTVFFLLSALLLGLNVNEYKICPYFCGFQYRWKSLDDKTVKNMIEMLTFIDEIFADRKTS